VSNKARCVVGEGFIITELEFITDPELRVTLIPNPHFPICDTMSHIVRFSVSLEDDLLERFERYCTEEQFATRSEAVRQLIRDRLTSEAWEADSRDAAGTLTLVYDHHRSQLRDHLTSVQHDHTGLVVATMHAHLTHDLCLEVIVLRGPAKRLRKIAAQLRGLKGIFKGELVMAGAEIREEKRCHHRHGRRERGKG